MSKTLSAENQATQPPKNKVNGQTKPNGQAQPGRVISDPNEVAQLVMMRIDHVNSKKGELTIAVKALADTAKQLVSVYANQQAQIAKLAKRVDELEKAKG
ncbi:MAG: hypothetical protein WAW75_04305 [Gallionella sp.]